MPKTSLTSSYFANIFEFMRVISKARLVEFWRLHANAKTPLSNWYNHVCSKTTVWASFTDVRTDYSSADKVGDCYVFNIGGNNFRLIAKIIRERVYIRKIMTHAEYGDQNWIAECKCLVGLEKDKRKPAKKAKKARRKR